MSDAQTLLGAAEQAIAESSRATDPCERFALAHLAGLRAAAAVVATHASLPTHSRRRRPTSVWTLLAEVEPELSEWATHYAAAADRRAAAECRIPGAVTPTQASDHCRDGETFLAVVRQRLARALVA